MLQLPLGFGRNSTGGFTSRVSAERRKRNSYWNRWFMWHGKQPKLKRDTDDNIEEHSWLTLNLLFFYVLTHANGITACCKLWAEPSQTRKVNSFWDVPISVAVSRRKHTVPSRGKICHICSALQKYSRLELLHIWYRHQNLQCIL